MPPISNYMKYSVTAEKNTKLRTNCVNKLYNHAMRTDWRHSEVMRDLAHAISRSLSVIFKVCACQRSPLRPRKGKYYAIFCKIKTIQCNTDCICGKCKKIHLEANSKHVKDKKVAGNSQHWFTKGKLCLLTMIVLYMEMSGWVNKCSGVTCSTLEVKLRGNGLEKKTRLTKLTGLVKNLLIGSQQFKDIFMSCIPLELWLWLILFKIFMNNMESGKEHSEFSEEIKFGVHLVNCHSERHLKTEGVSWQKLSGV